MYIVIPNEFKKIYYFDKREEYKLKTMSKSVYRIFKFIFILIRSSILPKHRNTCASCNESRVPAVKTLSTSFLFFIFLFRRNLKDT